MSIKQTIIDSPVPDPISRPAEYASFLTGGVLAILVASGVGVPLALLPLLPPFVGALVTGIVAAKKSVR